MNIMQTVKDVICWLIHMIETILTCHKVIIDLSALTGEGMLMIHDVGAVRLHPLGGKKPRGLK